MAGRPTSIFRLAAGLLTIEGRQGENRGQASRKSPRNLREKISQATSLSSRSLLANPQLLRQAEVGVKPRLAWLGRHSRKPVRFRWKSAIPAKQLEFGREIVPGARPAISFGLASNKLTVSWTGNYSLSTATNVSGPWLPLSYATSPYTNEFADPQRFFQLR